MKINLPSWPMQRLIPEACTAPNLRRDTAERLDPQHSEWPAINRAVLAFCCHNLTDYDRLLSAFERDLVPKGERI